MRFSNGKTRTLDDNESSAIWLPDQAFDRLKFELNLPSTARQYLENSNEDYPQKSLSGYPCEPLIVKPVIPRFIYATWPFYVPYYPACSYQVTKPNQPRDNGVQVNAKCIKDKTMLGSYEIKTDDLSRKIEEQIKIHEHLLNEIESKCTVPSKNEERQNTSHCCLQNDLHDHVCQHDRYSQECNTGK